MTNSPQLAREHRAARQAAPSVGRDSRNWYINTLYVRHEFDDCLEFIEECLTESKGLNQYALYYKALIHRQQGDIRSSLQLFQAAACLDPLNVRPVDYLKHVGKSLSLLGQHQAAIEVSWALAQCECPVRVALVTTTCYQIYTEALKHEPEDWELYFNIGMCQKYLGDHQTAINSFRAANEIQRHDATFTEIAEMDAREGASEDAIETYNEALEFSPENTSILTRLGVLLLKTGDSYRAFECLGNSLVYDPKDPRTILAAGSVIQDHGDVDVALVKYRVAAVQTPSSAELWNNVGMCFFEKRKVVAAIACLKRAVSLEPFQWKVHFNLGLLHLYTGQYASAFAFFSAALNLEPEPSLVYMYLGITLSRLDDYTNSRNAYARAIGTATPTEDDPTPTAITHLNCCITAFNHGDFGEAKKHFLIFDGLYRTIEEDNGGAEEHHPDLLPGFPDAVEKRDIMGALLLGRENS
ncbi:hypothetical protein FOZ61_002780 [Perkinsus olseni]|uniref:Bardet-Biedl syndrome 4 protein n=1 Tax=Perkinsus olseni TaxID=32597 RepID=A0A7J6MEN0_PEROL|nr:hypothetical protein FOZ61_002780 [Perkinsus olseni]